MTPEERTLISGLFDRLRSADTSPKDRDAEQLIQSKVAELPSAPYLLAQTVLVQEHALTNAQAHIADLERQIAAGGQAQTQGGGGSFLGGLFGGKPAPVAPSYPSTVNMAPSAGGGFLRTALAAAAGVAGGSLLFQGIEGLLGRNAGPFGSSFGGGGGFLGGQSEIIENNEVVNNYYEGNDAAGRSADAGFLDNQQGAGGGDAPVYQEADYETPPVDNPDYAPDDGGTDDFSGGSDDGGGLV